MVQHFDISNLDYFKVLMQGKLFKRYTHFLYCSVLSLGGKTNTRRMSQPDMESIFTYEIFWSFEFLKLSKFNDFNLLGYKRRTLMHLF